MIIGQIFFLLLTIVTFYVAARQFYRIWNSIHLGKPDVISGNNDQRWRNLLLIAFGQQKMFKRLTPAILHLFIYVAFLLTQIELLEILVDGIFGTHRFFAGFLGKFYTFLIGFIEILSVLALVAAVVFLIRRNIIRLSRFWKAEMTAWPRLDANIILASEIVLVVAILMMNSADTMLQGINPAEYHSTGRLPVSNILGPAMMSGWSYDWLVWTERTGWWLHVLVVFGFIIYLPYSKHLHIFLAFPNAWFARLRPRGKMPDMPEITAEVRSMLGLPPLEGSIENPNVEFGVKDIQHLSWKNIMDAYSCTECGRCTAVCPANITGKKLSPRKIVMDIRDRTEEVSAKIASGSQQFFKGVNGSGAHDISGFDDGRSLFDYISDEEIYACTACNACVEACPVLIDPLEPILQLRRYRILMDSKGPADWVPMFNSLESSGAVWQMPAPRSQWASNFNNNVTS